VVHIVLCATHRELILIDLNRGRRPPEKKSKKNKKNSRKSRGSSTIDRNVHMMSMLEVSVESLAREQYMQARARNRRGGGADTEGNLAKNLIQGGTQERLLQRANGGQKDKSLAVRRLIALRKPRRWICFRNRKDNNSEKDAAVQKVLGSWPWTELRDCEIADMSVRVNELANEEDGEGVQTEKEKKISRVSNATERTTFTKKMSQLRSSTEPLWMLLVHTVTDSTSEWPLPYPVLKAEEFQRVGHDVNEAIQEMRS